MIRHLIRLTWNRRRTYPLLIAEITISFLVVLVVVSSAATFLRRYRLPMGFDPRNVWAVTCDVNASGFFDERSQEEHERQLLLLREVRGLPEVAHASYVFSAPYGPHSSTTTLDKEKDLSVETNVAGDDALATLGLRLVEGRWFEPGDGQLNIEPIVIDQRMRRLVFRDGKAVGEEWAETNDERSRKHLVIGVLEAFRRGGELKEPLPYFFYRDHPEKASSLPLKTLVIRLRPGTPTAFEETLISRLRALAPAWSFTVEPLTEARRRHLQEMTTPLLIGGLLAGSLLLMVALGLVGVLWQTIIRRTHEIGIRRSLGATAGDIQRQIVGEVMVVTSLGLALGFALALQAPLLPPVRALGLHFYGLCVVLAAAGIYALNFLCAMYPSRLAAKVVPADALRYE
jgi:putative ABC transport system permease protein